MTTEPLLDPTSTGPDSPVGAGEKTLRVLASSLNRARFTDIVAESGLSKPTVHRILRGLHDQGWVSIDTHGRYQAGTQLVSLAGRVLADLDIATVAGGFIDDLVAQTGATVHMGALSGHEMVYVLRRDGLKPYQMRSRVGLALPMHSSGMGKAVLASWPEQRVAELIQHTGLPARTALTITSETRLREELQAIRDRGYAFDEGENEAGTVCVSCGVQDHNGATTHAVSVSSIALEHPGRSIEVFAPPLVETCAQISRALGYRP